MSSVEQSQLYINGVNGQLPANIFGLENFPKDSPIDEDDIVDADPLLFNGRVADKDLDTLTYKVHEAFQHLRDSQKAEPSETIVYWSDPLPEDEPIVEYQLLESIKRQNHGTKLLSEKALEKFGVEYWPLADAQGRRFKLLKVASFIIRQSHAEFTNNSLIYSLVASNPAKTKKRPTRPVALV